VQRVTHCFGAVADGEMQQHHVAAVTLDERADGRTVASTDDEVALPVTDAEPGRHHRRAVDDELAGSDETHGSLVGPATPPAEGSPGAQFSG
jgi:hypothetical protein